MNSGNDRKIGKMRYETPSAVDLGAAAPVVGGSCADGGQYADNGICAIWGNTAVGCDLSGNNAAQECWEGNNAELWCRNGASAVRECLIGARH